MHTILDDSNTVPSNIVLILERRDLCDNAPAKPEDVQLSHVRGSMRHIEQAGKVLYIEGGAVFLLKNRSGLCGDVDAIMDHYAETQAS